MMVCATSTCGDATLLIIMAISTKRRRKIDVGGRQFVWWVAPDLEEAGLPTLHICSTDKRFIVRCVVGQGSDEARHLVVLGPELPPLDDAGGRWIRLRTPVWDDAIVTPRLVRRIIEWGLDPAKSVVRIDWQVAAQINDRIALQHDG